MFKQLKQKMVCLNVFYRKKNMLTIIFSAILWSSCINQQNSDCIKIVLVKGNCYG